jgi:hypothetical protein
LQKKEASRFCKQCGDKYCTACYNRTHAGGKRAAHSFTQIGPVECSECEKEVGMMDITHRGSDTGGRGHGGGGGISEDN